MVISQRNGTTATTTADDYPVDRFQIANVSAATFSAVQSTTAPAGFNNSFYFNVTAADSSVTGPDRTFIRQRIEGYNTADLGFGTASAKTITLSAQVYSSVTGTFGGAILNNDEDRSFAFTYTIASANTWTQIAITVPGDQSGTWNTTNGVGLRVTFGMGCGATVSGTAGAWATASYFSATSAVSVVGTSGATWYITGLQLEVGTQATTFTTAGGSYGAELALCQRYYFNIAGGANKAIGMGSYETSSRMSLVIYLPVSMRTGPTLVQTTGTSYYYIYRNGGYDSFDSFTLAGGSSTIGYSNIINLSNSSEVSGTAGQSGFVASDNGAVNLSVSAEL
jgi:hypothetical protein